MLAIFSQHKLIFIFSKILLKLDCNFHASTMKLLIHYLMFYLNIKMIYVEFIVVFEFEQESKTARIEVIVNKVEKTS